MVNEKSGKGPVKELPWSQASVKSVMFWRTVKEPFRVELLRWPLSQRDCMEEPARDPGKGPDKALKAKWRMVRPDKDPMKSGKGPVMLADVAERTWREEEFRRELGRDQAEKGL